MLGDLAAIVWSDGRWQAVEKGDWAPSQHAVFGNVAGSGEVPVAFFNTLPKIMKKLKTAGSHVKRDAPTVAFQPTLRRLPSCLVAFPVALSFPLP